MENDMIDTNKPKCMPHCADTYSNRYSLTNFINAYYQIKDCMSYQPDNVLLIGVGVGIESILLKYKFNINLYTLDIDPGFKPDFVGSVHELSQFKSNEFDVIIVSHVLEHLAFHYFERSIREISRVSRHALIYLPYGGRHAEIKFSGLTRLLNFRLRFSFPPIKRIDGLEPVLCGNEHYWECGYRGFGINKIKKIISKYLIIDKIYHNKDWSFSINFCLTSK